MKKSKISRIISIILYTIVGVFAVFGLVLGIQSHGATGLEGIGTIFILPSIIALLVIVYGVLVTVGKIKTGLKYSIISSIIKVIIIICCIVGTINEFTEEMEYGMSNLEFSLYLLGGVTLMTIPSILNTIRLLKLKKEESIEDNTEDITNSNIDELH